MTRSQDRLYAFLLLTADQNVQPSIREIGDHLGVTSRASLHRMLVRLEAEGMVERLPLSVRCWRAVRKNRLEAFSTAQLEAELERRGFDVTLEQRRKNWTVCPDCLGDSPNWPGNRIGCQTCESEGGWKS